MLLTFEELQTRKFVIAGPNVIESKEHAFEMAKKIKQEMRDYDATLIFKTSFDKANRTSASSYRGVSIDDAKELFHRIRSELGIPCITDVHEPWQAEALKGCVDILQIPAFLCRQTDLLKAASETGLILHIKKGQFCSAAVMKQCFDKCVRFGNRQVILCERGNFFGYQDFVVDPRNLVLLRGDSNLVSMDITHCLQLPGSVTEADGTLRSGGQRHLIPHMGKMAISLGADGIFVEVHDNPDSSLCDAPTQWPLSRLQWLLEYVGLPRRVGRKLLDAVSSSRKVHFCGVGKSKIACSHAVALLKSLSFDAAVLDAGDSLHGDVGCVAQEDMVVFMSKSGNTEELRPIAQLAKQRGSRIVGVICAVPDESFVSAKPLCMLRSLCDEMVILPFTGEIRANIPCLPTKSVVAQIEFVNCLAAQLSDNVTVEEYQRNHPSGSIGVSLCTADKVMIIEFPRYSSEEKTASIIDLLLAMTGAKLGIIVITLDNVTGIITDGDLRRLRVSGSNADTLDVSSINTNYTSVERHTRVELFPALHLIPVVDDGVIIGIVDTTQISH